jgi:hypothetical protein
MRSLDSLLVGRQIISQVVCSLIACERESYLTCCSQFKASKISKKVCRTDGFNKIYGKFSVRLFRKESEEILSFF